MPTNEQMPMWEARQIAMEFVILLDGYAKEFRDAGDEQRANDRKEFARAVLALRDATEPQEQSEAPAGLEEAVRSEVRWACLDDEETVAGITFAIGLDIGKMLEKGASAA